MAHEIITPDFALDESLVLRTRVILRKLAPDDRDRIQELLDKYLRAAFIATGPDPDRAGSWLSTAKSRGTDLLRAIEVAEVATKGRPSCT